MNDGRNYYMVRAMDSSEACFDVFFKGSVVATGWSKVDFTEADTESVIKKAKDIYYRPEFKVAPQVTGRNINEIKRFREIKKGDYIIVPYYSSVRLAVALGEVIYSKTEVDLDNQHKVLYVKKGADFISIPRDNLSEALQRRLRVRGMSVADLYEFGDEIEKLFSDEDYSYSNEIIKQENKQWQEFKGKLLNNICHGKTGLKTGGIGLEELVAELFRCEGYTAKVCSKRMFDGYGDADVEAAKSDKFLDKKIFAQVKHHYGDTSSWGIEQLIEIINSSEYADYSYVFVTSASVPKEVSEKAENAGIAVIDGEGLVSWIVEQIPKLSDNTKAVLGISNVPTLLVT